jgi:hypothetical protein
MHPDRRTVNVIAAALIVVSEMCDRIHQARSRIVLDFRCVNWSGKLSHSLH